MRSRVLPTMKIIVFALFLTVCYAGPPKQIVRPCHLNDYKCIGDNLSANSKCNKAVQGFIPSQLLYREFRFEGPYFNESYIDNNLIVRNVDKCRVSEFFFNMKRDTAVLAIDCPEYGIESDRTVIRHASLKEDTRYSFKYNAVYPLVRVTMNIPNADHLDVCRASVFGDVTSIPRFLVQPKDRLTANYLSQDLSLMNIYERETFFYRAPQLIKHFINSRLCNFGCY